MTYLNNLPGKMLLAALVATSPMAALEASAKIKEVKFHFATTQLDDIPYMAMEYQGGTWKWTSSSKSFNARLKVYFKASGKAGPASVRLTDTGQTIWALPSNYQTKKYEKLETVGIYKTTLSPFQGKARAICDVFGGSKKHMHDIKLNAEMAVSQNSNVVRRKGHMPLRIVCMPKGPSRSPVETKAIQVKLYTIPAKPACGKEVNLVAEIHTNKPGKVDFNLVRNDGATQKASLTTQRISNGKNVKRWAKSYTFNESVNRRYQIVLAGQPMSSPWVDMKVNCGVVSGKNPGKLTN